jgi:predicted nuclease of predicted toxin-antitoxin system
MARLYADENFPLDCVQELRALGHDVLTVQESNCSGCTDEEVLTYASAENRTVITFNRRHFIRLHSESQGHAGIIVCTFDADFAALASRIDGAFADTTALAGTLIRINRPQ